VNVFALYIRYGEGFKRAWLPLIKMDEVVEGEGGKAF